MRAGAAAEDALALPVAGGTLPRGALEAGFGAAGCTVGGELVFGTGGGGAGAVFGGVAGAVGGTAFVPGGTELALVAAFFVGVAGGVSWDSDGRRLDLLANGVAFEFAGCGVAAGVCCAFGLVGTTAIAFFAFFDDAVATDCLDEGGDFAVVD